MAKAFEIDQDELIKFNKTFSQLMQVSKRTIEEEVFFKARDASFKLYKAFDRSSLKKQNPDRWAEKEFGWNIKPQRGFWPRPQEGRSVASEEAERRMKARKYIAVSWMFIYRKWKGKGYARTKTNILKPVKTTRCEASFSGIGTPIFSITLKNLAKGVEVVEAKYSHVSKALSDVRSDMENRIKKQLEKVGKIYIPN